MDNEPRMLRTGEGDVMGSADICTDRFMIEGADAGGRFALVEHTIAPGALAAPMHRHTKEDEFTYVLEGTFAAMLGDREVVAGPGDLVFKPRGQWHTFWNPGTVPTRVLEMISPAGLEAFFRLVDDPDADPDQLGALAATIGCDVDEDRTKTLIDQHGLRT